MCLAQGVRLGKHFLHPDPARRKHQAQDGIQANSGWCLETCSCVLHLLHSVSGGEEFLILCLPMRGLLWVCAESGCLNRMLFHLAGKYSCAFLTVRGMDGAQKRWISCVAKDFFFQSLVCVVSLPHL